MRAPVSGNEDPSVRGERQGRAALTDEERQTWDDAVAAYANRLSRQTSSFQPPLAPMTIGLAAGGDREVFPVATFEPGARANLERAAPVYRKA